MDPTDQRTGLVTTVKDNEALYPKRDVIKAKAARQLQQRLANPPDAKLKRALPSSSVPHTDILPADVTRATDIYGPSLEALKGRTTTRKAIPFPHTDISTRVTDEQNMFVDLFYACKEAFLITKVLPLGHTMVTALDKTDTTSLRRALRVHLGTYGQRRIAKTSLYSDNERGITAMASDFAGAGITPHQSGPGMHVHVIERAIRHIKELARGTRTIQLPNISFPTTSRLRVYKIQLLPRVHSPFQLLYNRTPNAKIDAQLEFGCCYQYTARDPDNSMTPRRHGGIGVGQIPNGTGTCRLYNLHTAYYHKSHHRDTND